MTESRRKPRGKVKDKERDRNRKKKWMINKKVRGECQKAARKKVEDISRQRKRQKEEEKVEDMQRKTEEKDSAPSRIPIPRRFSKLALRIVVFHSVLRSEAAKARQKNTGAQHIFGENNQLDGHANVFRKNYGNRSFLRLFQLIC